jgi:hypothetical protein
MTGVETCFPALLLTSYAFYVCSRCGAVQQLTTMPMASATPGCGVARRSVVVQVFCPCWWCSYWATLTEVGDERFVWFPSELARSICAMLRDSLILTLGSPNPKAAPQPKPMGFGFL